MKSFKILLAILLITPVSIVLAEDHSDTQSKTIDVNGTSIKSETSHSDTVGITGVKKSTDDQKTTVDPKGLMNKKTIKKHSEHKLSPNGDYSDSVSVKEVNGTVENSSSQKKTSKNWTNKGETVTTTHSESVDPKGLGNKQSKKDIEKDDINPNGTEKKTVTNEVNGETISKDLEVTHK